MIKHKRNKSPLSWFTTYFVFISYLLVALECFNAGTDIHHRWFTDMTFDFIIAMFWAGLGIIFSRMAYHDGKLDGNLETLEEIHGVIKQVEAREAELEKKK